MARQSAWANGRRATRRVALVVTSAVKSDRHLVLRVYVGVALFLLCLGSGCGKSATAVSTSCTDRRGALHPSGIWGMDGCMSCSCGDLNDGTSFRDLHATRLSRARPLGLSVTSKTKWTPNRRVGISVARWVEELLACDFAVLDREEAQLVHIHPGPRERRERRREWPALRAVG